VGSVTLLDGPLDGLAGRLLDAGSLALDLESNGLYAYRARPCVMQIGLADGEILLIDPLASDLAPLAAVLGPAGPVKILHDLAFDARLLAQENLPLGNVRDTLVAAHLLGYTSLGLATLAAARLNIQLSKGLQRHDWSERPLTEPQRGYLASDVQHLHALDASLFEDVERLGILDEVREETAYRLQSALASEPATPGHLRQSAIQGFAPPNQAALRRLFAVREVEAERRNVAPFRVCTSEWLVAVAAQLPSTEADLRRLGPFPGGIEAGRWVEAIRQGLADGARPPDEQEWLSRPPPPAEERRVRRDREERLKGWRSREARRRGVSDQVVLPGHVVQHLTAHGPRSTEELLATPGFGAFRVERYGAELLQVIVG
jgi:ribonuclease D